MAQQFRRMGMDGETTPMETTPTTSLKMEHSGLMQMATDVVTIQMETTPMYGPMTPHSV